MKRVRPIGCFNNIDSMKRIIYGVIHNLNNKWKDRPLKKFYTKDLTLPIL
jgi:transposase-like protein